MNKGNDVQACATSIFWKTVQEYADDLQAPLYCEPDSSAFDQVARRINLALDALNAVLKKIYPRLSVQAQQACSAQDHFIQLIITGNFKRAAMADVSGLVASAPALPRGLRVQAFKPPLPPNGLLQGGKIEIAGRSLDLSRIRLYATPVEGRPGVFDLECFVPASLRTAFDDGAPGAMATHLALRLVLGEYKLLACTHRVSVELVQQAPPDAVPVSDLDRIMATAGTSDH